MMDEIFDGLNAEQRKALDVTDGPLLILAGAGSGKTKTLTHRIAHLIAHKNIWPNEILAVTFTNKAAREMRERLASLLHMDLTRNFMPWMGTFHGICVRLLRVDGGAVDVDNKFVIYDEADRLSVIKKAMKDLSIADNNIKPKAVSSIISKSKNDMVSAKSYQDSAEYPFQKEVGRIYGRYEILKQQAGALDFDDLLIKTVEMLQGHKEIRDKWSKQFKYVLVDEYQDTNTAQYSIIKLLLGPDKNLCVVGDDWQSIYSWRGADFTNILNFERDFPGATVIKLEQNYRSTGAILEGAHKVISNNVERTDKKLWTQSAQGLPIAVRGVYDEAEEAYVVAEEVAKGGRPLSEYAILYRMNAQSYAFERALIQHRIPYQIVGGVRFYDRREIKDLIAYVRLLYQPRDVVSFMRIANLPKRGIGPSTIDGFLAWRGETGNDILTALIHVDEATSIATRGRKLLGDLGRLLGELKAYEQAGMAPSELIAQIIDKTNYRSHLKDGTPQAEDREENVDALVSDAQNFASISNFLEEASLMSSADMSTDGEQVTLMTLHAAKGLEFPVVFMAGLEEGVFPHARVIEDNPKDIEEERRLCYVGMTRAREELFMLYAASRLQFGQRGYNMPSRFLEEMGHSAVPSASLFQRPVESDDFSQAPQFDIGDQVKSQQFGIGEVIDTDGLAVTVHFDNGQIKKLNTEFARLEKVT